MDAKKNAEVLWNYLKLGHDVEKSDHILVFGSHDLLTSERAAELYLDGIAENIIITGGHGRCTGALWNVSEAEKFAEIITARGVPGDRIMLETKASNTGENIRFSRSLLEASGCGGPVRITAVCQPFRERRVYASLMKQWQGPEFSVTSIDLGFEEYFTRYHGAGQICPVRFFDLLAGEFQRVEAYGRKGYMLPQIIPEEVIRSFRELVSEGFTNDSVI